MFVYKIIGNFTNENFGKILNKIQDRFKFIYKNNALYLCVLDYKGNMDLNVKEDLKEIFKDEFLVNEITENNIMKEEDTTKEWCRDCLVDIDRQRYEYEKQERLKAVMQAMDNMKKILDEEYKKQFNNKNNNTTRKED